MVGLIRVNEEDLILVSEVDFEYVIRFTWSIWTPGSGRRKYAVSGMNKGRGYTYFENEIEAALAYDTKAKELFGEYARTNF